MGWNSVDYCTNITFMGSQGSGSATNFAVCQNPLPIELLSFEAVRSNDAALLLWETGTEINNAYFQLERSVDGQEFLPLQVIPGAGNSNSPIQYSYLDSTPVKGLNYYRLRQVDYDGTESLSDIRVLDFSYSAIGDLLIFPNPLAQGEMLSLYLPEMIPSYIRFIDLNGRIVFEQAFIPDSEIHDLNPGSVNAGLYIIQLSNRNGVYVGRLIVQ